MRIYTNFTIALALLLLSGCAPAQEQEQPGVVFKITGITSQATAWPVEENLIVVAIDAPGQDTIDFLAEDVSGFSFAIPAGSTVRVLVESPGFKDWEMIFEADNVPDLGGEIVLIPLGGGADG